jgi:hypothetical protein
MPVARGGTLRDRKAHFASRTIILLGLVMIACLCELLLLKNFRAGVESSLISASFVLPWSVFIKVYFG